MIGYIWNTFLNIVDRYDPNSNFFAVFLNITWYKIISEFNPLSNYNKLDFQWLKRNDLWECNFQTPFQTPKLNYLSANHISLHNNAYKHVISSYNLITVFVRSMLITWKFFTWVCVGACYLKRATIVFLNSTEVISGGCQILKTTEWFDQIFIDSKLLIFNIELEVFFYIVRRAMIFNRTPIGHCQVLSGQKTYFDMV